MSSLSSSRMMDEASIRYWLQGGVIALFVWNLVLFSIALRRDFSRPDGVQGMMRALALCGAVSAITDLILLFLTRPVLWQCLAGIALLVASQWLMRAAVRATADSKLSLAFSGDVPTSLNRSGPYRFIRHPFYTAYSLTWLAAALVTAHPAAIAALCVMVGFYLSAARREESKFLRSSLADRYRCYQKSTGMFFPFSTTKPTNNHPNT